MIKEILLDFPNQFSWEPEIENGAGFSRKDNFVIAGMGGSRLSANIIKSLLPKLNITIHHDYGLPNIMDPEKTLVIASSYSGNTEETADALMTAIENNIASVVVSSGGKILEIAKENNLPFIKLPDDIKMPRFAVGYSFIAISKFIADQELETASTFLCKNLNSAKSENKAKEIALKFQNKIPIIYGSNANGALARIWKISFNETAQIPAFFNTFPELNHNEMQGFDTKEKTIGLMEKFQFLFLKDSEDDARIINRMETLKTILERQEFKVDVLTLEGESRCHKVFDSVLTAFWTGLYLAEFYGINPEELPIVEKFKKLIST